MEPILVLEVMSYSLGSHMHQLCDIIWGVGAWMGSCLMILPRTIMIVSVSVYRPQVVLGSTVPSDKDFGEAMRYPMIQM